MVPVMRPIVSRLPALLLSIVVLGILHVSCGRAAALSDPPRCEPWDPIRVRERSYECRGVDNGPPASQAAAPTLGEPVPGNETYRWAMPLDLPDHCIRWGDGTSTICDRRGPNQRWACRPITGLHAVGGPIKVCLPPNRLEGGPSRKVRDYHAAYCQRWSDGCEECHRQKGTGRVLCEPVSSPSRAMKRSTLNRTAEGRCIPGRVLCAQPDWVHLHASCAVLWWGGNGDLCPTKPKVTASERKSSGAKPGDPAGCQYAFDSLKLYRGGLAMGGPGIVGASADGYGYEGYYCLEPKRW